MQIVWLKVGIALGCLSALAGALAMAKRLRPEAHAAAARFDLPVLWVLARLLPFLVVYVLLGYKTESDVATCFWPQASGAFAGQVPYRDFESFFGPLYPYLLAVPLIVWKDPRALVLWMTLLEAATIALTLRAARLDKPGLDRTRFLLCCFLAPGPLMIEVIGGQEDFLLWTSGVLTWFALRQSRDILGSGISTLGMLAVKALYLLPLAAFFGLARSRWKYLAVLAPVGALTIVVLHHLTGTAFLGMLGQSGNISPPQIWIPLHLLSQGLIPSGSPLISFSVILVLLGSAFYFGWKLASAIKTSPEIFMAGWTMLFALLMVLSPKSQGAYFLNLALPCLALALHRPRFLVVWAIFGALAGVEPSIFYRLGEQQPGGFSEIKSLGVAVDLGLQAVMVVMLLWIAREAWRTFNQPTPAT